MHLESHPRLSFSEISSLPAAILFTRRGLKDRPAMSVPGMSAPKTCLDFPLRSAAR